VGYRFSLVLSREVTDDEAAILRNAGCANAVFGTDTLPTNADIIVTKMDFDETDSPSLADAIQSGLDAVKSVPELSVPGLTVPAQPAGPVDEGSDKVIEGVVVEDTTASEAPATKKPAAKKATTKRTTTKAAKTVSAEENVAEPVGAAAGSS
jgi:hypothetical protein